MKAAGANPQKYAEIGRRIRFYRDQAGIRQAELSHRIGFKSSTTIFYMEQGEHRIKVLDLLAIAKVLGIPMDLLLSGNASETSQEPIRNIVSWSDAQTGLSTTF